MGRYCRICGRERPNEQFSGKGRKIQVCKHCRAKLKNEGQAIEDKDGISGFLEQSHISERTWPALNEWLSRAIRKLPALLQLFWTSPASSHTKPEDSSSLHRTIPIQHRVCVL